LTRAREVANVLSTATALATDTETAALIATEVTNRNAAIAATPVRGNTASRPASPATGDIYSNTQTGFLEVYTGATYGWEQIGGIASTVTEVTATNAPSGRAYNNGSASIAFTPGTVLGRTYTAISSPGSYTATGSSSPIVVTGLQSSTQYTYTVTSTNNYGTSSASSASSSVTATTVPQAPTIGTATAGDASATVAYTAGATGGSAVTTYTATSSPGGFTGTGSSPITVSGLTNGTSYTFTVTATNANGTSLASSASSSVTPIAAGFGTTWFSSSPATGQNRMKAAGWTGSVFIGVYESTTAAAYSADGITWTNTTTPSSGYWYPGSASVGGNFSAIVYEISNTTNYSSNGTTWTVGTMPTQRSWYNSASNLTGTIKAIARWAPNVATSTNGATYTEASVLGGTDDWRNIGWCGGTKWVVVGQTTKIMVSTNDASTFTQRTLPGSLYGDISSGDGNIIIVSTGNQTYYTSTDNGANWTSRSFPTAAYPGDILWNGKTFVAQGNAFAWTSTDGITWTQRTATNINFYSSAVGGAGNNTFIGLDYSASNPRPRYSTY